MKLKNTGIVISGSWKMELLLESIDKDIVRNPYSSIIQWSEQRLKLVGKKTFPVLALMPVSLIAPDMPYQDKFIRSNIHTLILGGSGSSKSTLVSETFGEITYNPLSFNDISKAELVEEFYGMGDDISALCPDIDMIFKNPALMKILEGITGEEKTISSRNMRRDRTFKINAIFLGAGLPTSMTRYASYGMLRRVNPIVVTHTTEEKDEINKYVKDSMFSASKNMSVESIKKYYMKLWNIQKGKDSEFKKIEGYIVEDEFKEGIYQKHRDMSFLFSDDKYLYTELHSGFRYMCNHAMLNMFNRKTEKNRIVITREDYIVGINLLDLEMRMKYKIFKAYKIVNTSSDVLGLYNSIIKDDTMDITFRDIAKVFIEEEFKKMKK